MTPVFRRSRPGSGTSTPSEARGWRSSDSIDGLLYQGVASFRRRLIAGTTLAVVLLAGISTALAWRQYDDARTRAMGDLEARVVAVSGIVDTSFAGQIASLTAIAKAPSVVNEDSPKINAYFARLNPPRGGLFSGGLGWIVRSGRVRASSTPGATGAKLPQRLYFKRVLATGKPYVSAGLIGRRLKQPIVVIAVPTRDHRGRISGVLAGSILLKTVGESRQALELGYADLQIIDRNGRLLLETLRPVANQALLARIDRSEAGTGVVPRSRGLDDHGSDVVAFATSKVPGWVTVIDRPRSTVFAAALHALVLELASMGAGVLLILATLTWVTRRSRRASETQNRRARSWSGLTRALATAASPPDVASALLSSLSAGFTDAAVVVAFEHTEGQQVEAETALRQARRLVNSTTTLEKIAPLGKDGANTRLIEHESALRDAYVLSGRRLDTIHSLPILDPDGQAVGTIALVSAQHRLEPSEWDLLGSFADQSANALERVRLFAHEHDLAVRLQRSLLPDRLPSSEGIALAGHYQAGGDAVEVGGDWYDALRRPDGIIQLCVGDVSGKGIGAATVMGRQRNVFHVYAHDFASPAEIIRRMLRHVSGEEMITITCVSLDPYTGELTYACAGHPPPLLVDRKSGRVQRLDRASAPPIGVAEPGDIVEVMVPIADQAILAMYTDGLIERRGQNIDEGIDLLGRVVAADPGHDPDRIVRKVSAAIGAPDDDVALLLIETDGDRTEFQVELPAEPSSLPGMRRRLRAWLERHGCNPGPAADVVLAVSEACNNAIEHAYADRDGTFRVSVERTHATITAVVEDQGSWRETEPSGERGRGIVLMRHLMQAVEITGETSGTRVTLVRELVESGRAPEPSVPASTVT